MPTACWTGHEHCRHCLQAYAYELEITCVACDGPLCPACVVQERFDAVRLCPDCARDPAPDEEG